MQVIQLTFAKTGQHLQVSNGAIQEARGCISTKAHHVLPNPSLLDYSTHIPLAELHFHYRNIYYRSSCL